MAAYLVFNPNSSKEMTDSIRRTVLSRVRSGNRVDVLGAETGPRSLESFYEYSLAVYATLQSFKKLDVKGYDGILLACFGDPGLYALKEISRVPVVGIAEASLSLSLLLGARFAIVTALQKAVPMMRNMVDRYALRGRMAGVYALDMPVLELETCRERTCERLRQVIDMAIRDGAEAILLGCAGMTGLVEDIGEVCGVSVIDPIVAGFCALEMIVESGVRVASNGLYARPFAGKELVGMDMGHLLE